MTTHTGDLIVFDSLLHRSNLPQQEKSYLRRWVDRMTGGALESVSQHYDARPRETMLEATLATLRQTSEGMAVGGILGALNAHDAIEPFGVPADGAAGALLTSIGVLGHNHEASKDARNAGSAALTVYAYRKVDSLLRVMGARVAGEEEVDDVDPDDSIDTEAEMGADSIVEFSKTL